MTSRSRANASDSETPNFREQRVAGRTRDVEIVERELAVGRL